MGLADIHLLRLEESKHIKFTAFLKQRSRKHKIQETFTVSHASWRKHSTFDPCTVKTTAGIYKGGEKGASLPLVEIGRWDGFTAQTYQNSSVCFFLLHSLINS